MSESKILSEEVLKRANECVGWIIENIGISDSTSANDLNNIVKSAYLSGYKQAEIDVHKHYSFEKIKGNL